MMPDVASMAELRGKAGAASLFKSIADFCREYQPLAYVVESIVRSGSLYTLTAKTGHGKTGLLTAVAFAVVTDRADILGRSVEAGRVAYLAFENPDDVRMRLMLTAYRFGIVVDDIRDRVVVLDRRMGPEEVCAELQKLSAAEPFRLVVGDTLASWFDGKDVNDAVQGGEFMRRVRPITRLAGAPSVIVAAHPRKDAQAESLIPYGSGAILNEVDGNLAMWKADNVAHLHWQGKIRGLDFQPVPFKFELCSSPDVLDVKGRQVQIPVCVPMSPEAAEDRTAGGGARNLIVLRALYDEPGASQRRLILSTGISMGALNRALAALKKERFIEQGADEKWRPTRKGRREIGDTNAVLRGAEQNTPFAPGGGAPRYPEQAAGAP
jgi:hypothetical protein